jgi:hypothetical protein
VLERTGDDEDDGLVGDLDVHHEDGLLTILGDSSSCRPSARATPSPSCWRPSPRQPSTSRRSSARPTSRCARTSRPCARAAPTI